jgi:hypothetical protein
LGEIFLRKKCTSSLAKEFFSKNEEYKFSDTFYQLDSHNGSASVLLANIYSVANCWIRMKTMESKCRTWIDINNKYLKNEGECSCRLLITLENHLTKFRYLDLLQKKITLSILKFSSSTSQTWIRLAPVKPHLADSSHPVREELASSLLVSSIQLGFYCIPYDFNWTW